MQHYLDMAWPIFTLLVHFTCLDMSFKEVVDRSFALFALLFLSPVLGLVSLLVLLNLGSPVFFFSDDLAFIRYLLSHKISHYVKSS